MDQEKPQCIPSVINWLARHTLFTKFNICWGYNNIHIKQEDKWKAAFLTPKGLFEPTVMFFGLTNSPATFQMLINTIFRTDVAQGDTLVFMDDIAIHTKKWLNKTHEQHLKWYQKCVHKILDKLKANNLYLKPEKCTFEQEELKYLGIIIGKGQLCMDLKKLKGITNYPVPQNPTNVYAFLGLYRYYWYFIP